MVMLVLALASASSPRMIASTIGTYTLVQGCTIMSFDASTFACTTESSNVQSGFSAPSQTSFSGTVSLATGANATLNGTAYADAGVLEGSVSETVSGTYPVTSISAGAVASMEDTITISDPSLNDTAGSLVLGLSLDANANATQTYNANGIITGAGLYIYAGASVSGLPPTSIDYFATSIDTSYSGPAVPFVFGQPFSIETWFDPSIVVACQDTTACASWSGGVYVDASDTAILDSLTVYNTSDNVVSPSDWSVTDASGLDYTAHGIVPEPSSYSILGLSLALLAAVSWWRRRGIRTI
jgi:hypothetical protein